MTTLSSEEINRYSRHLILPEVGPKGQEALKASSVLCIGAGGLGCPLLLYLAAAGVGRIGIVDFDVVDDSNLQRQVLYGVSNVGQSKAQVAKQKLLDLNPFIKVDVHEVRLTSENALDLFKGYDVIADGTDNFQTRYLVNDACVLTGKPNVYGSIFRFEGMVSVFNYQGGPNYRCLYSEPPPPGLVPSCAEGGVLGVLPGVVATLQANEVIKILLNMFVYILSYALLADVPKFDYGLSAYKKGNCMGCHKWHGDGGPGYGGAALSLRETGLDREQLITIIECGRPGTNMPFFDKKAYMNYVLDRFKDSGFEPQTFAKDRAYYQDLYIFVSDYK